MAEEPTKDETNNTTTSDEPSGIAQSNNFLGLLPPPYSMSTLKNTLPLFQTSPLSSTSSSSYTSPYISQSFAVNNDNHTSYTYRSSQGVGNTDSMNSVNSSYPISSSTYRPPTSLFSKPSLFQQTREKEKLELSTLNDKFADYVEKVRYLEAQNKKIQMETGLMQEKQQANCQRIKSLFETEVGQLKEVIEKLFKDKNTIGVSAKEAQNAIHPLRQRLNQTFKETDSSKYETEKLERQLSSVEGDVLMYKRRLAHQDDEHTQWKQLITHLQRLLLQAKNEIQNETIGRTSCEQTVKQLRLDVNKLREQQQQKLKDLKQNTLLSSPNATNDRAHMFKSELSSAIRKIRQDFERNNDAQRSELYAQFTQAYEDIARQYPDLGHLFLNEREQERIKQEEDRVRNDIQRVKTDTNSIKQKNAELKLRTRELQINLEMSVEENKRFQQIQQNEIDELKLKQERIAKDYDDVLSKQTTLEKEIETYRNLLEGTMKTVVDTITDDFNSSQSNQTKYNTQQQNGQSARAPRSASVDRTSSYVPTSRLNNGLTNSYSRFTTYRYNNNNNNNNDNNNVTLNNIKNQPTNSTPTIDIPTSVENGLTTSKSVGDLTMKNIASPLEIIDVTNGASSPTQRPPTILQTRRS